MGMSNVLLWGTVYIPIENLRFIILDVVHDMLWLIGSMDGIFTYVWFSYMVNVGKYTMHESFILWVLILQIPYWDYPGPWALAVHSQCFASIASTQNCPVLVIISSGWSGGKSHPKKETGNIAPPKSNIDTKNDGVLNVPPFNYGYFGYPC